MNINNEKAAVRKPAWQARSHGQTAKGGVTVCESRRGEELAVRVRHGDETILGTLVLQQHKCYIMAINEQNKLVTKLQYEVLCNARESWVEARSDKPIPEDALTVGCSSELGLIYFGRVHAFGTIIAGQVSSRTQRCSFYYRRKGSECKKFEHCKYEIMLAPLDVRQALSFVCNLPDTPLPKEINKSKRPNQKRQRGKGRKNDGEPAPQFQSAGKESGVRKLSEHFSEDDYDDDDEPVPLYRPTGVERVVGRHDAVSSSEIHNVQPRFQPIVRTKDLEKLFDSSSDDDPDEDPLDPVPRYHQSIRKDRVVENLFFSVSKPDYLSATKEKTRVAGELVESSSLDKPHDHDNNSTLPAQSSKICSQSESAMEVDSDSIETPKASIFFTHDVEIPSAPAFDVELAQEVTTVDNSSEILTKVEPEIEQKSVGVASSEWVSTSGGAVPPQAVDGGTSNSGEQCYVVRADHGCAVIPGFLQRGTNFCTITSGGKEIKKTNFEVLCDSWTKWIKLKLGDKIPDNAIIGGLSDDSQHLFIGRVRLPGVKAVTIGKVDPVTLRCYILYQGSEHGYSKFELLVRATLLNVFVNKLSNFLFKPSPTPFVETTKSSSFSSFGSSSSYALSSNSTAPSSHGSHAANRYAAGSLNYPSRANNYAFPSSRATSTANAKVTAPSFNTANRYPSTSAFNYNSTQSTTTRPAVGRANNAATPRAYATQSSSQPFRPAESSRKEDEFRLQELETTNGSFKFVCFRMQSTIMEHTGNLGGVFNRYDIIKVERIWNSAAHRRYLQYRRVVSDENGGDANEVQLFHGSPICQQIAHKGFDERHAKSNGMFGSGVYFAEHSSKSNQYVWRRGCAIHADRGCTLCERHMLLCRVALGNVSEHLTSQKFSHAPPGHHAVKGVPSTLGLSYPEYIIYRGEQAFPEYLITYRIKLGTATSRRRDVWS